jgi:hypothetical protein
MVVSALSWALNPVLLTQSAACIFNLPINFKPAGGETACLPTMNYRENIGRIVLLCGEHLPAAPGKWREAGFYQDICNKRAADSEF